MQDELLNPFIIEFDDAQRTAILDTVQWVRRRIRNFICRIQGGHEYYAKYDREYGLIVKYNQQCLLCKDETVGWDLRQSL